MKILSVIFLVTAIVSHASDSVGIAGGGASSGVSKKPHSKKGITSSHKIFDMNEPVGVAGGGASSGVHVQKGFVPFNQLTPDEKELLEEQRKGNLRLRKDQDKIKDYRTNDLVIVNDYSEINGGGKAMMLNNKNAIDSKQLLLCTKASFLAAQELYGFFVPSGYICKEVNDDYLLFVPETIQYNDLRDHIRNRLVGLNFASLPDYSYEVVDSAEFEKVKMKSSGVTPDSSGKILLETLKQLKITDVSSELLPYFNIYLTGHGGTGVIADISAQSQGVDQPSDFLKVIQFFDKSFKTKSVALSTCYIGGKQNIDTYSMYDQQGRPVFNQYDNALLENLSYPIINWGSLYKVTYTTTDFAQYFGWLNEEVPEYEKILNSVRYRSVDNWISIKFPHISWFSPVELQNKSQTLSQVAMSTQKTAIDIKPTTEVIILQANYIPQPVVVHDNQELSILPVNYHEQSYYFKKLRITGQSKSTIFDQLQSLIFSNVRVREEINFAFESLQINNVVYKNVHCFVSKFDNVQGAITGFIYEDPQENVVKYSWPADDTSEIQEKKTLENPFVKEERLTKETWDQKFSELSDSMKDKVPESLQSDFITKLEKTLPISNAQKVIVGKSLDDIADQLSKKLLKPVDLKLIVPLLQKGMKSSDVSIRQQVKNIFEKLIREHVITADNFKVLLQLLKTSLASSLEFVRNQSYEMTQSLIGNSIITTDNWGLLLPILKSESKNSNRDIREEVVDLLRRLVENHLVVSLRSIQSLIETGLKDSDIDVINEYMFIIRTLSSEKLITKTDIEHFKNLVSNQTIKNDLELIKANAPEIIQDKVPVDQIDKLLVSLHEDITSGKAIDQKKMNLLYRLVIDPLMTVNKLLLLMNPLLSVIEVGMNDSNQYVRLDGIMIIISLIDKDVINSSKVGQLLLLVDKSMNDSDIYVRSGISIVIQSLIDKDLISLGDMEQLLPLVEKGMNDSDKYIRLGASRAITSLIDKGLISLGDMEQLLPLVEKGVNDSDEHVRLAANSVSNLIKSVLASKKFVPDETVGAAGSGASTVSREEDLQREEHVRQQQQQEEQHVREAQLNQNQHQDSQRVGVTRSEQVL